MRTLPFSKTITAAAAAALLIGGTSAGAFAATLQSNPIQINSVQLGGQNRSNDDPSLPYQTDISFTNQYSAPATNVVFALEGSHGEIINSVDDTGTFAPGVKITHGFPDDQLSNDLTVAVVSATFADGSTWQNPLVADVVSPENDSSPAIVGTAATDEY